MDVISNYTNQATKTPPAQNLARYNSNAPVTIQAWKAETHTSNIEDNLNRVATMNSRGNNQDGYSPLINSYAPIQQNAHTVKPYGFKDVLDVVNPLHHIPLVNTIYQSATGDEIKPMSRIIGGSLFGGPVGAIASTINTISEMRTGEDLSNRALKMVGMGAEKKPIDRNFMSNSFQSTDDMRTVNWQTENYNNGANPYHNYYAPVTEITLSPMPPRTLIDA